MRLTEFVRRMKPRDDRFFEALERHGDLLASAAGCVVAFADRRASAEDAALEVRALDPASAARLRELEGLLGSTYGTPLGPRDLHALGQGMHEVVGGLEVAIGALERLEGLDAPPYLRAQLRHLGMLVGLVARHVPHLRDARYDAIVQMRTEARRLERAARESLEAGMHGLFDGGTAAPAVTVRVLAAHEGSALAVAAASATAANLRSVALKYT
jgi:hypothetical protein